MDPNAPPAPPPMSPNGGGQPNYDFIMNPQQAPKRSLLPGGGSKTMRIVIFVVGIMTLLTIGLVVFSAISNAGKADTEALVTAAKQQQELIRVAEIGVEKARTQGAKDIAITTKLALQSQQADMVEAVKAGGRKLSSKELASGKSTKTDETLTTAEQNNRFDEEFLVIIQTGLTNYQKTVKIAYDSATSKKLKTALTTQYKSANTLAGVAQETSTN